MAYIRKSTKSFLVEHEKRRIFSSPYIQDCLDFLFEFTKKEKKTKMIDYESRQKIEELVIKGMNHNNISKILGWSSTVIKKEIELCSGEYTAEEAHKVWFKSYYKEWVQVHEDPITVLSRLRYQMNNNMQIIDQLILTLKPKVKAKNPRLIKNNEEK